MGNWQNGQTYNAENQITSGGMTYDANGNMTKDETGRGFVYNAWNKLVKQLRTDGTTQTTYKVDGLGRRVAAGTQVYTYSKDWQIIQDKSTVLLRQYVWSLAYVDAMVLRDYNLDSNDNTGDLGIVGSGLEQRIYPMQDANWNVTGILTVNGGAANVAERYVYDPYGLVTCLNSNWTQTGTPQAPRFWWYYLHQGGRWDGTAGLYHFRNRDYSPTLGRWMAQDPLGYIDGGNLYQAYRSSPAGGVDPSGLAEWRGAYSDYVTHGRVLGPDNIVTFEYVPRPTWDPVSDAYWDGFDEGAGCWAGCMADLHKQLVAVAVAGAASGAIPVHKSLVPEFLKHGWRFGGMEGKSRFTGLPRITQNTLARVGLNAPWGDAIKKYPIQTGAKGGVLGLVWTEAALGSYCAANCMDGCP